jgi:hypothetical protein
VQAQEQPYRELYQHAFITPYSAPYQHEFLPDGTPVAPVLPEAEPAVPVARVPDAFGELYQVPGAGLVAPTASDGVDWTDAGIGAGMALGVLVLAGAAAIGFRRRGLTQSAQS